MITTLDDILYYYYSRPIEFVEDIIGAKPTEQQKLFINSVCKYKKVAVKSGHKTGKSTSLAWLVLWFMATRFCCKIPCTAPTTSQLKDVLWAELSKWHRQMDEEFSEQFIVLGDRFCHKDHQKEYFAIARTARKENPEALQGYYANDVMFILDEAAGIPNAIFDAIQGSIQGKDVYCLLIGNPRLRSGFFFDAFHDDSDRWCNLTLNAEDSPLTNADEHLRWLERFGKNSIEYRVKVLGEFPLSETDALIGSDLLQKAIDRQIEKPMGEVVWGCDPARFGTDECALAKRRGNKLLEIKTLKGKTESTNLVGWLINEINQSPTQDRPSKVYVDSIGLGGPIADFLRESNVNDVEFIDVNVAESSNYPDKYNKLRDELWCLFRDWLYDEDPDILNDKLLFAQASTIHYKYHSNGSIVVEKKDEMKRRGLRSPDRADAVCLTFYYREEVEYKIYTGK